MNTPRFFRRLFALCTLSLMAAASSFGFEGKIVMSMTAGKDSMPITYYVKGTKMRTEFTPSADKKGRAAGSSFAMIVDWERMETTILMSDQKMYMVQKLPDMTQQQDGKKSEQMDFKPTGRKEKIAGYEAEEYVGKSEGKRMEIWVTKDLGNFMMANQAQGGGAFGKGKKGPSAWEKFMREGNFFALRVIQRAKEGAKEDMRMEVTNVDEVPQADALFRAPKDFEKFEMPNMGGMLKGLIPGGGAER